MLAGFLHIVVSFSIPNVLKHVTQNIFTPNSTTWTRHAVCPTTPDMSCYMLEDNTWMCAYDYDINLNIDPDDSY